MEKFLNWFFGIMGGLLVLTLVFVWVIFPFTETNDLNNFCKNNNYDEGEFGQTIFQDSFCVELKGNSLIKKEVERCESKQGWCFVKRTNGG